MASALVFALPVSVLPMLSWAAEADQPELSFLEYLGAMVHEDGEWMDPLELREAEELGVEPLQVAEPTTPVDEEEQP